MDAALLVRMMCRFDNRLEDAMADRMKEATWVIGADGAEQGPQF